MNTYSYEEIIEEINNGIIKQINFCVDNYAHYKNCMILRTEDKFPNGRSIFLIDVILTKDSEKYSFLESFEENTKLFHMGRKGRFTLKQLWPHITIKEIVYN